MSTSQRPDPRVLRIGAIPEIESIKSELEALSVTIVYKSCMSFGM